MTFTHEEGKEDRDNLVYKRKDFVATTSNKQLNFLQHVMSVLSDQGRAAVVVPDNVLFEGGAGEVIRRRLLNDFDVHTLLRLPTGIFYAHSVKANVLFFDRKPADSAGTGKRGLWVYNLRSGNSFSLKSRPLVDDSLLEFTKCFRTDNRSARTPSDRFRCFDISELLARERCSLDVGLDDGTGGMEVLPPPAEIAAEIIEKLEAAADAIRAVEQQLSLG
jgi:type I restriction enzyme M protein